jgi:hemerythrin-like domain-containing protein
MIEKGSERRPFARNPLDVIVQDHALQMELCDALERIADGLPDDVDRRLCTQVATCLQYDLPLHHQDEEEGLFPLLRTRATQGDGLEEILDRLSDEHVTDVDFAAEIVESLEILSQGGRVSNPDMVGYMLRGFFERYRRHVHWENTLVIPLARLRLTEEDISVLSQQMDTNRAQSG